MPVNPTLSEVGYAEPGEERTGLRRLLTAVFWVTLFIQLIPLCLFSRLPSADGPVHLFNSKLLIDHFVQETKVEAFYFTLNRVIPPNVLGHVTLAFLIKLFGDNIAENILIAAYIIGLALSYRYFVRSVAKNSWGYECMIFPFLYNMHVFWGFYNFCLSIIFFLLATGYLLRRSTRPSWVSCVALSLLVLLAYLSSPVGFAETCISVLFLLFADFKTLAKNSRIFAIRSIWTFAALAPGSIMYLLYSRYRLGMGPSKTEWPSIRYPLSNLFTLAPISAFGGTERIFGIVTLLLITILVVASIWVAVKTRTQIGWRYLGLAVVLAVVLFISPTTATGGTMITPRLVYFPIFVVSLMIPLYLRDSFWRIMATAIPMTIAIVLLIIRMPEESRYNRQINDFLHSIPVTKHGGSLLFLTAKPDSANNSLMEFITHNEGVGGYLAVERDLVLVNNYEANTDYFPFLYKANRNPYPMLVAKSGVPECSAVRDYEQVSGRPIDYVVLLLEKDAFDDSRSDYSRCGYSLAGSATAPYKAFLYSGSK